MAEKESPGANLLFLCYIYKVWVYCFYDILTKYGIIVFMLQFLVEIFSFLRMKQRNGTSELVQKVWFIFFYFVSRQKDRFVLKRLA